MLSFLGVLCKRGRLVLILLVLLGQSIGEAQTCGRSSHASSTLFLLFPRASSFAFLVFSVSLQDLLGLDFLCRWATSHLDDS